MILKNTKRSSGTEKIWFWFRIALPVVLVAATVMALFLITLARWCVLQGRALAAERERHPPTG
jgi:hypothetical protein